MNKIKDKLPYVYTASDIAGFLTGIGILFSALLFIYQVLYNDSLIYLSGYVGQPYTITLIKLSFLFFTFISYCVFIYIKKINNIKLKKIDFFIMLLMAIFIFSFFNIYKVNNKIITLFVIICIFFSFFYELYNLSCLDFLGSILICIFFVTIAFMGFLILSWSNVKNIEILLKNNDKFSVSEYIMNDGNLFIKVDNKRYLIPFSAVKSITTQKNNNTIHVINMISD